MNWKLADAKNRFSELFNRALAEGPQRIQRRDRAVIVLEESEYEKLVGKKQGFIELLMSGPGLDGVDLSRDKSPMRDVKL